jgi:uncharacterized protein (TIGR03067 family)
MRSLAAVVLGVVVAAAVAAPRAKDKADDKNDLKKFTGEWTVTAYQYGRGDLVAQPNFQPATWSFDGDAYTLRLGQYVEQGTVKLDQTKKVPTIDMSITAGADQGKSQLGIYKLDGDTLTFCLARAGMEDRPVNFTIDGTPNLLITLKRKK